MAWIRQDRPTEAPPERPSSPPTPPLEVLRGRNAVGPASRIGRTVHIKGEVRADEDLIIDGKVEGKVLVRKHRLTFGESAVVQAQVRARWIVLSGELKGEVTAADRLEITAGGRLLGDVRAPRLVIADGAHLNGGVDTDPMASVKPDEKRVPERNKGEAGAG